MPKPSLGAKKRDYTPDPSPRPASLFLLGDLLPFLAGLGEGDGNGLFSALYLAALSGVAALLLFRACSGAFRVRLPCLQFANISVFFSWPCAPPLTSPSRRAVAPNPERRVPPSIARTRAPLHGRFLDPRRARSCARPRLAGRPGADLLLPGKARRVVQIPDDASVLEMQLRREIELDRHAAETSDSAGGSEGASSRTEMMPLARPRDQEPGASWPGLPLSPPRLLAAVGLGVGLGKLRAEQEYLR